MRTKESVVGKALWYLESHSTRELTLEVVAAVCGVGPHHLTRAFAFATGYPVMRYLRARRLTEAARRLAAGAPAILEVALDAGFSSHEAFTRAFREEFGATPEQVRERKSVAGLPLVDALSMDGGLWSELVPPRFEPAGALYVAGFRTDDHKEIPALWQRFAPHISHIPGQRSNITYGVCDAVGYLCGVEVTSTARVGDIFEIVALAPAHYAVFAHPGHISTIRKTWFTLWNQWLPESAWRPSGAPEFERYGPGFNPSTGAGGLEIWVPVEPK